MEALDKESRARSFEVSEVKKNPPRRHGATEKGEGGRIIGGMGIYRQLSGCRC